jgi:tetratricopeptide (TPR) repeat protein
MRLLQIQHDGTLSLTKDLHEANSKDAYAVLSHTWQEGEVTFDDLKHETWKDKAGYKKIRFSAQQAQRDGLRYIWVDTCCINKADVVELQHAINSMFRWYRDAARCYVFLSDVPGPGQESTIATSAPGWEHAFRSSQWFTRGWTLQELLAPRAVSFFSREWKHLGERHELKQCINEITGIPVSALGGAPLDNFGIDERLSWSNRRQTTYKEDRAYSLLGMFNVFMPLIYGEGEENAFRRLRKKIEKAMRDDPSNLLSSLPRTPNARARTAIRQACYTLPFSKNSCFIGRKDELEMLNKKLLVNRDCNRMSIVGLGGTGKTQLALHFAYTVKETMSAVSVFWLPALSMESFEQACASIVAALRIGHAGASGDDAKVLVREHLSSGQAGRWLLVLDNADDYELLFGSEQRPGILEYLPHSEEGVTIYTTRMLQVAVSLTGSDVLKLGAMSQPDATSFLRKSQIQEAVQDDGATGELLDELACLPLAISQAVAYMNINGTPITKYLRLLQSTEQGTVDLVSKEFHDAMRYKGSANGVATTWLVSFEQICERNPAAAELLAFMSCIEWKAIPRSLLPNVQSEERMEEAIGTLCGYSFVSRREENRFEQGKGDEEWYDLHRLVHLATRIWIRKHGDTAGVAERAMKHVAEAFPTDDFASEAIWRGYMPHAVRLLTTRETCSFGNRSRLSLQVGRCLLSDGRVAEAVQMLEECQQLRLVLDIEHPDRLASQYTLATAYQANGQIKEAIELLENVVAVQAKVLREEHPDRLASQHVLAYVYQEDGQVKEAVKLLKHVVAVEAKMLKEEHPSRLASQHDLARAYRANGQVREAMKLAKHVVRVQAQVLEEEHPLRLASQQVLACTYLANGQVKEAVKLFEHVVSLRARVLKEQHPSQLASQHDLAIAYQANGQVNEAVKLFEHVVSLREQVLKKEHPYRLASQHALALGYAADRRVKQAIVLLEHVVAVREKELAEDHPDRLASQHALAVAYEADGQVKQAVMLLEHVVTVQEVLAEDHPSRLASQHELARAYQANGQVKQAVMLLEHVVTMQEVLAEDHPSRLASQHALAVAYEADGQVKQAVMLLEHVVTVQEVLAEDHPSRLASQHELARAYQANGQFKQAVALLEHVVAVEARVLREDYPSRLVSVQVLQGIYVQSAADTNLEEHTIISY